MSRPRENNLSDVVFNDGVSPEASRQNLWSSMGASISATDWLFSIACSIHRECAVESSQRFSVRKSALGMDSAIAVEMMQFPNVRNGCDLSKQLESSC